MPELPEVETMQEGLNAQETPVPASPQMALGAIIIVVVYRVVYAWLPATDFGSDSHSWDAVWSGALVATPTACAVWGALAPHRPAWRLPAAFIAVGVLATPNLTGDGRGLLPPHLLLIFTATLFVMLGLRLVLSAKLVNPSFDARGATSQFRLLDLLVILTVCGPLFYLTSNWHVSLAEVLQSCCKNPLPVLGWLLEKAFHATLASTVLLLALSGRRFHWVVWLGLAAPFMCWTAGAVFSSLQIDWDAEVYNPAATTLSSAEWDFQIQQLRHQMTIVNAFQCFGIICSSFVWGAFFSWLGYALVVENHHKTTDSHARTPRS